METTNGMSNTRFPINRSRLRNNSPSYSEDPLINPFVYHSNKNTTDTIMGTSRSNGANHNSNRNNNLCIVPVLILLDFFILFTFIFISVELFLVVGC